MHVAIAYGNGWRACPQANRPPCRRVGDAHHKGCVTPLLQASPVMREPRHGHNTRPDVVLVPHDWRARAGVGRSSCSVPLQVSSSTLANVHHPDSHTKAWARESCHEVQGFVLTFCSGHVLCTCDRRHPREQKVQARLRRRKVDHDWEFGLVTLGCWEAEQINI